MPTKIKRNHKQFARLIHLPSNWSIFVEHGIEHYDRRDQLEHPFNYIFMDKKNEKKNVFFSSNEMCICVECFQFANGKYRSR